MKRICIALALMLSMAAPAFAVDFTFNGDLNHRFRLYTNQVGFFNGAGNQTATGIISDEENNDFMGEIKYRLWTTASSDDGKIKGVYAVEIGAVQFGSDTNDTTAGASQGGDFSGDEVNIETRWAYTDFALGKGRTRIGLMPIKINKFLWQETVTGVDYKVAVGAGDLTLAWYRGHEVVAEDDANDFEDLDAFYIRYDLKTIENMKLGMFALWQTSDAMTMSEVDALEDASDDADALADAAEATYEANKTAENLVAMQEAQADAETAEDAIPGGRNYVKTLTAYDLDLYTLGVDGSYKAGNFFTNWDVMFQFGDFAEEEDFGGYFGHVDLGMNMGKGKLTYTFWYASGDDDADDGDWDAFVSTDVDINSQYSAVLFEGYTDDDYFAATPYIQDKGLILNRLGYDYQVNDKLKVGVAALYLMTAEDLHDTNNDGKLDEDEIGTEFDAYVSYKLFSNTEVAMQAGYLMTGDAMDYYEVESDGSADEDVYILSSRLRYKF